MSDILDYFSAFTDSPKAQKGRVTVSRFRHLLLFKRSIAINQSINHPTTLRIRSLVRYREKMSMLGKRARITSEKEVLRLYQREVGELSPRAFTHTAGASENLVLQLDLYKKLGKHRGCVNTVSFNAVGDILVSGSDDRMIKLWDWEAGLVKLSFHSGHTNNVFQAKIMPFTDDRNIVSCAADGQVRHSKILEDGKVETVMVGKHQGSAHKLSIEPGSPHIFYTCGEDGLVQHFDLRTGIATKLFACKSFRDKSRYGIVRLNTITIDPRNPNFFAVGGSDEYARLYDIRRYKWDGCTDFGQPVNSFCPSHLIGDMEAEITGLSFSYQSELLVSYKDEQIYLFTRDMGLGPNPIESSLSSSSGDCEATRTESDPVSISSASTQYSDKRSMPQVYTGHMNGETVKGVGFFGPKCEYVVSGSDCGRIFIWNKKGGQVMRAMEADKHVVNCIDPHPHATFLASSGIENDVKIWIPKASEKASLPVNLEQLKHQRRHLLYRISYPKELMFQILSLQSLRSSPNSVEEDSEPSRELLDLVMSFNSNRDSSSDDNDDTEDSSNDAGNGDCS
ncbi:DDB1- and CUL4-associated factor 8-like isoform X1 [Macadamia integrifolia]|uniref:DDB1- and CUL4-associated factor 8-like isoform X1 n=1 Tax=Macadamia integrifolia TaxID=60698 RepID=UPI001C4F745D|nr:DDB1- and CUL4-associated factor 8-like isoform X1 [Macadamia integrifolia]